MDISPSAVGARLREERQRLGLTQAQIGEAGGVKTRAQIYYESGERSPDTQYLAAVSKLGVDVQYVITGHRCAAGPRREDRLDEIRESARALREQINRLLSQLG